MTTVTRTPDLMTRLREQTRADHDATEAIPYSAAIVSRTLPRPTFTCHLRAMLLVHEALEPALQESNDPVVDAVWRDDLAKAPLLRRDLDALGWPDMPADTAAAAEAFGADIERTAADDPVALLGFLYVLEGSTLGGTILRLHLMAMYGIDEHCGLAYYWPYGRNVMAHWKQFKTRMNAAPMTGEQCATVIAAARRAFRHIGAILQTFTVELDHESTTDGAVGG